jgi:osmotically-inducible protein OsmY
MSDDTILQDAEVHLPFDPRRHDDETVATALSPIACDIALPVDAVKIKVEQGWLTLTGTMDHHFQKEIVQEDVRRLHGVVGASNHIAVKPRLNAEDIIEAIMHALHRSWFVDPLTIQVTARDVKVRLSGTVPSAQDRRLAAATAWGAPGVIDVENDIEIATLTHVNDAR